MDAISVVSPDDDVRRLDKVYGATAATPSQGTVVAGLFYNDRPLYTDVGRQLKCPRNTEIFRFSLQKNTPQNRPHLRTRDPFATAAACLF